MFLFNRVALPALHDLASAVSDGSLSLTQALSRLDDAVNDELSARLKDALRNLQRIVAEHADDLEFRRAFFELGMAAAQKVNSANGVLNFGINLGGILCMELGEVERGLHLMETALQQMQVVQLEYSEMAQVILAVGDAYTTFHSSLGPDYLKAAEECYRTVLQLPGAEQFEPLILARAESGFGLCLADQGEQGHMPRADEAIEHYRRALQFLDSDLNPELFSLVMHNLGNAFRMRGNGNRAENLNMAVSCLRSALDVRERSSSPDRIRFTSSILAEVEGELGHPFQAIALFEEALETLNPIQERREFSRLHLRLATFSFRAPNLTWITRDHLKRIARASYMVAKETADPERDTDLWAAASAGLAMAWQEAGLLDDALSLQQELLGRLDPKIFSHRCAVIASDYIQMLALRVNQHLRQFDMESANRDRNAARAAAHFVQDGDIELHRRAFIAAILEHIEECLAQEERERNHHVRLQYEHLTQALNALTTDVSHEEAITIQNRMIEVSTRLNQPSDILKIAEARLAQESDFLSMKPSLVDYYNYCNDMRLPWDIVIQDALLNRHWEEAFRLSDRSRARSLDLMAHATTYRHAHPDKNPMETYLPEAYRRQHAEYVREWQSNVDENDVDSGGRRDAIAPYLRESFLQAANWRGHWVFESGQVPDEIDFEKISFPDQPTALIEFWCGEERAFAFIQMPDAPQIEVVELPGLTRHQQMDWIAEWFRDYGDVESRGTVALPKWAKYMQRISVEMGESCWGPLGKILETQQIRRLLVIPDLWLGSLPFQAMTIPDGSGDYLCNRYEVGMAPSYRHLARGCAGPTNLPASAMFIGNPQDECPTGTCQGSCRLALPMAQSELGALRLYLPDVNVMMGGECTPDAVLRRLADLHPELIHISSHGVTRFEDPLASGLIMAYDGIPNEDPLTQYVNEQLALTWGSNIHGEVLSLDAILRQSDLRGCSLAVLNACEVGLNYIGTPRESLNLAAGFLAAGVQTIISPLWPVVDAPASLLTGKFYSELQREPAHKLRALTRAQRWLQNLSYEEAKELVNERQLKAGVALSGPEKPFSHIFFWAPYQFIGRPI